MTTPDLNGPRLSNLIPAEPETNDNVKIETNMELLMELQNNTYNGAEANDAVDNITIFLQIIALVKIPNVELVDKFFYKYYPLSRASRTNDTNGDSECHRRFMHWLSSKFKNPWKLNTTTKNALWNFWEKGYDNDTLIYDEESSDDESYELNYQDTDPFFDPYLNDKDKGNKSNHMEYNKNSSEPENFIPNDAPHSGNTEQPNEGMCRVDKFEVIKYLIRDYKEFLGIRTLERDSWAQTINGISNIYLDIFHKKNKGWTDSYLNEVCMWHGWLISVVMAMNSCLVALFDDGTFGGNNYEVTCEDEAKRRNSGTKMKTFEENCYLLLHADSDKLKRNNVAGPLVFNVVEHNNSIRYYDNKGKRKHQDNIKVDPNKKSKLACLKCSKPRHLKKDYKGVKVGNKANGAGTNGSRTGSSNPLKGQIVFDKSVGLKFDPTIPDNSKSSSKPSNLSALQGDDLKPSIFVFVHQPIRVYGIAMVDLAVYEVGL
ncbi:hypothetical protein Tco_0694775, partial [Tanacetum coccineum]